MKFVLFPCSEISPKWYSGPASEPVFFASHTEYGQWCRIKVVNVHSTLLARNKL